MGNEPEIWKCPKCGECLDIGAFGFYSEVVCPVCAHRAHVHTRLANFQLEGVLGVGGMSVVLSAKDLILSRPLAIKVLNDTYRDQPERIARFEAECAMMARVRHENVVSVYSAGRARGQFYIAMELIRGTNLETLVTTNGPMPPTRVMDVARQIVLGLQAAHKAGLLHRDMKPGNVIIDEAGKARVLDFGLSLGTKTADTESVIWATPYYVPPETLKREAEDVRTDIYALGMSLRFLLTGEHKLPGDGGSVSDLLKAKRNLQPLGLLSPQTPAAVCKLVDRMTAFTPSDRPASYTSLLESVDEVRGILQDGEAAKSPARVLRRYLLWSAVVAGTLLLGGLGATLTTWLSTPSKQQAFLEYVDYRDSSDLVRMGRALKAARAADWSAAASGLEGLGAADATEPTMGAMASLLRMYIAAAQGSAADEGVYREHFKKHLRREKEVSPAGAAMFAQLRSVDAALDNPGGGIPEKVASPELRAVLGALHAKRLAAAGEADPSAASMRVAKEEFGKAHARYTHFGLLLATLENTIAKQQAAGPRARVMECLASHDFTGAENELAALLGNDRLPADERASLQALRQIASVGRGVAAVFAARTPDAYRPGISAEEMKAAAAGIDNSGWAEEVYALGLLLKGEFDAAFAADPYRKDARSDRPFAILMREWKSALGH